jgi:nucleotide-binding universal stress UspA family protein
MDFDIRLRKILVPTDLSDHADHAFRHAAALALRAKSELVVLHVVEKFMDHSLVYSDVWPFQKPVRDHYRKLEQGTKGRLEARIRDMIGPDLRFRVLVTTGVPSAEILSVSEQEEVDLIVIATHGRGGLAQALLGSTTERVLRKSGCPVLVIRSGADGFVTVRGDAG